MDWRLEQWREAVKEAINDVETAPNWRAERAFRFHLSHLIEHGARLGFPPLTKSP